MPATPAMELAETAVTKYRKKQQLTDACDQTPEMHRGTPAATGMSRIQIGSTHQLRLI
jgi:hypothetical protein